MDPPRARAQTEHPGAPRTPARAGTRWAAASQSCRSGLPLPHLDVDLLLAARSSHQRQGAGCTCPLQAPGHQQRHLPPPSTRGPIIQPLARSVCHRDLPSPHSPSVRPSQPGHLGLSRADLKLDQAHSQLLPARLSRSSELPLLCRQQACGPGKFPSFLVPASNPSRNPVGSVLEPLCLQA